MRSRWVSLGSPRLWLVKALNTTLRPLPLHQYVSSFLVTSCCVGAQYFRQLAASAMTETVMPPEMLANLSAGISFLAVFYI